MGKKEGKAEWELKFKKAQSEYTKEVNADLEKLTKLKTEDFKSGIVDHLRAAHESITNNGEAIFSVLEFCGEERDKIINAIGGKNKQIDEEIEGIFKRLVMVEGYLFCAILKLMSTGDKTFDINSMQGVQSDLSIDIDGVHEFLLSINEGNGRDKLDAYINSFQKKPLSQHTQAKTQGQVNRSQRSIRDHNFTQPGGSVSMPFLLANHKG